MREKSFQVVGTINNQRESAWYNTLTEKEAIRRFVLYFGNCNDVKVNTWIYV